MFPRHILRATGPRAPPARALPSGYRFPRVFKKLGSGFLMMTVGTAERLIELAQKISDEELRELTISLLKDPRITFTPVEPKISFFESPAAPKAHHAYPGGLIDHTEGVTRLSISLADAFRKIYGIPVNEDFLIAGALLHDIFKYYQYERDPITGGFKPRDDWYLSHEFALIAELTKRGAPEYLIRIASEIHGTTIIKTPEGRIIHFADKTDAAFAGDLQDIIYRACIDIERETNARILAIKAYYAIAPRIKELIPLAAKRDMDALREKIKELLE